MPRVNIFIRKENEDRWNSLANKSEWVNDALSDYATMLSPPLPEDRKPMLKPPVLVAEPILQFPGPFTVQTIDLNEDPYPGYKIHRITGDVVDTINQEQVEEVDKEMLDYLKKNGRYI